MIEIGDSTSLIQVCLRIGRRGHAMGMRNLDRDESLRLIVMGKIDATKPTFP
jgi:hypothetical protein